MALTAVLAYDISSDNARVKVAALVSAWGDRIQRSVYILTLSDTELTRLLSRIERLIDVDHDAVHVFIQCQSCDNKARHVGQATAPDPEPYWIV